MLKVVRLTSSEESTIADLDEESAAEWARADVLERELATDAGGLVDRFIAGDLARLCYRASSGVKSVVGHLACRCTIRHALCK